VKKYFKKKDGAKVTEENFPKIKGNSFFGSKYKIDDIVFSFLLNKPTGKNSHISFQLIIEEELKKLEEEYNFIRYEGKTHPIPMFIKKEK